MDYIIIICMIVVFLLGFFVIDKFGSLIDPIEFALDDENLVHSKENLEKVLVFGNLSISKDILKLLEKQNISYTTIKSTNDIDKYFSYKYLIAVDELDLENLFICNVGKKMMGITEIIAICNFAYNKKIFEDNHIPYLCGDNITASQIVSSLFLSTQKLGGDFDVHI